MEIDDWDEEKLARLYYLAEESKYEEEMMKLSIRLEEFYHKVSEMVANINKEFKELLNDKTELENVGKSDKNNINTRKSGEVTDRLDKSCI